MKRLTLNLGVRWDRQSDEALAADVPANPLIPDIMPGINFPGLSGGVMWNDISPRLGMTYDLSGTGKSVARASYAMYFGQMGPASSPASSSRSARSASGIRGPTSTAIRSFSRSELNLTNFATSYLTKSASFDPANPTSFLSPGTVDPNIKNDRTREFILGLQQELMRNLAVEVNYVWRKYDQFTWTDRTNWDANNFVPFTLNPTNCGPTAVCAPVTYYRARHCSRPPTSAPTSRTASATTTASSSR